MVRATMTPAAIAIRSQVERLVQLGDRAAAESTVADAAADAPEHVRAELALVLDWLADEALAIERARRDQARAQ